MLVAQFLRARAWWRLDSAGASAVHVARSVVCLLDAAAYLSHLPEDDPHLVTLEAAGCFSAGTFDPGPEGAAIIREWQLADKATADAPDLLTSLAQAAPIRARTATTPDK
jgi:hypothetical protein